MSNLLIQPAISVGDILTVLTILFSIATLVVSLQKDRQLRRKEYADRRRYAAGAVTAKLERWRELALRFFEDIQPLFVEIDSQLVREPDFSAARDALWKGLVSARSIASQRILDEQIETAYIDLLGYDPRLEALFTEVVRHLKKYDFDVYTKTLLATQDVILKLFEEKLPIQTATLGNNLRNICRQIAQQEADLMEAVIKPFREEMIKLIQASDVQIFNKQIEIVQPVQIPPSVEKVLLSLSALAVKITGPRHDSSKPGNPTALPPCN